MDKQLMNEEMVFTPEELAGVLKVSRSSVYRMRDGGQLPKPMKVRGIVRWRVKEIWQWIEAGMPNRMRWEAMQGGVG